MKFTDDQIQEIINSAKVSLTEATAKELAKSVEQSITYQASQVVGEFAKTWVTENILPEVKRQLVENQDALIAVAAKSAEDMAIQLAKAMSESLKKTLESSYSRNDLLKKMFGC